MPSIVCISAQADYNDVYQNGIIHIDIDIKSCAFESRPFLFEGNGKICFEKKHYSKKGAAVADPSKIQRERQK